jgi:hypothetical protein
MGEQWIIEAVPSEAGVDLRITLPIEGETLTAVLNLDRAQARSFGHAVLAAAGDAETFGKSLVGHRNDRHSGTQ